MASQDLAREFQRKNHLTDAAMCRLCGVPKATYSRWMSGQPLSERNHTLIDAVIHADEGAEMLPAIRSELASLLSQIDNPILPRGFVWKRVQSFISDFSFGIGNAILTGEKERESNDGKGGTAHVKKSPNTPR